MKKKLVLMTSALMAIGLLAGCGSQHAHNWGEVVYEWSTDHTSCTATRVCKDDESHKETETKKSIYAVTKEAKCEENGSGRYTVTFDNEVFGTTHFDITLKQTGHEWGAITYTWADDYSSCTATRVCKNDSNHIESETASSAYTVTLSPTCDEEGTGVYDVAFENEAFEVQSHEVTLPATGHDLTAHAAIGETCTEAGNSAYWSCERCEKFFSDAEGKNEIENGSWIIPAHHTLTHHEGKDATRLEDGNIEYWSCDVCEKYFSDEEGKNEIDAESVIIPALGTDKTYFYGTYWRDSSFSYVLNFRTNNFSDYDICYEYYFSSFDYDDETKELSFIITGLEKMIDEYSSPYEVGDKISFTYNAEKDALMFGKVVLSKQ